MMQFELPNNVIKLWKGGRSGGPPSSPPGVSGPSAGVVVRTKPQSFVFRFRLCPIGRKYGTQEKYSGQEDSRQGLQWSTVTHRARLRHCLHKEVSPSYFSTQDAPGALSNRFPTTPQT